MSSSSTGSTQPSSNSSEEKVKGRYKCKLCSFVGTKASTLKRHLSYIHDVDIVWHECKHNGCSYKAKSSESLKSHVANIHTTIWFPCPEPGCLVRGVPYKAKSIPSLRLHSKRHEKKKKMPFLAKETEVVAASKPEN